MTLLIARLTLVGTLVASQPLQTVQSGETVSDLTIRLVTVPAFQMSGVVVDEAGVPAADVMVILMDGRRGADSLLSLSMEPRGMRRFTFGAVPSGSNTLRAGGGGVFSIRDDFVIGSDGTPRAGASRPRSAPEPGTIEVTLENASVSGLEIVVPKSQ